MKKIVKFLSWMFVVMLAAVSFVSCGDDEEEEKETSKSGPNILGMWKASNGNYEGVHFLSVYNFIDSNTVIDYSTVSSSKEGWRGNCVGIPEHSGWYYGEGSERYLAYYVIGNNIYIADGHVLMINGDKLLKNESNFVYQRW